MKFIKIILCLLVTTSCVTKPPTIAHTHVGHILEGFAKTPNKEGLLAIAKSKASLASNAAQKAVESKSLLDIKKHTLSAMQAVNPAYQIKDPKAIKKSPYGLKKALAEAVQHIQYAASSADASNNVKHFAETFKQNSRYVLDRCDIVMGLGDEILRSSTNNEAKVLAREFLKYSLANAVGIDINGDGHVGPSPKELGLAQLNAHIKAMLARERPVYHEIGKWYLFNIVKLPSGQWIFKQRDNDDY